MSTTWKLYRILCVLQMVAASFVFFIAVISCFRQFNFANIAALVVFLLIILQAIFAINLVNNNYPDTPVAGEQKKSFNRLFLLNFIFLAVLFGFTISEFRAVRHLSVLTGRSFFQQSFTVHGTFLLYALILVFQLVILYGLYALRNMLYTNFMKRKFEFEERFQP